MKRLLLATALLVVMGLSIIAPSVRLRTLAAPSFTSEGAEFGLAASPSLSDSWNYKIQRWESLIVQEAERRQLDPDLLAALVWIESRGDPEAVGPAGAVGLMQVMPKERGFSWRPTQEALMDPGTNLFWGTRTLATVIRQGKGDVFSALAAYNGGWEKTTSRGPMKFAATILRDYATAVVRRYELPGGWTAVFAVKEASIHGPIWIADSARDDVYAHAGDNTTSEGGPLVPDIPPSSVVASCFDEDSGTPCEVGIWIFDQTTQQWVAPPMAEATPSPGEAVGEQLAGGAQPDARPSSAPAVYVMAGSARPSDGTAATPSPTAVPPPVATVAQSVGPGEGAIVGEAGASGTPTPGGGLPNCAGGPLTVDAWPLDRTFIVGTETTPEGWKVLIYAEGRGGDCVYTYAWNDESDIRLAGVRGAATFEVTSTRRDAPILGTVVVISGDSVHRVGMYVNPPK